MTASELKYLIAASELNEGACGARMAAMAERLKVSKVSVCRAVERLTASGYLCQNGKRVLLTEKGLNEIADYLIVIDFIGDKLERHFIRLKQKRSTKRSARRVRSAMKAEKAY